MMDDFAALAIAQSIMSLHETERQAAIVERLLEFRREALEEAEATARAAALVFYDKGEQVDARRLAFAIADAIRALNQRAEPAALPLCPEQQDGKLCDKHTCHSGPCNFTRMIEPSPAPTERCETCRHKNHGTEPCYAIVPTTAGIDDRLCPCPGNGTGRRTP